MPPSQLGPKFHARKRGGVPRLLLSALTRVPHMEMRGESQGSSFQRGPKFAARNRGGVPRLLLPAQTRGPHMEMRGGVPRLLLPARTEVHGEKGEPRDSSFQCGPKFQAKKRGGVPRLLLPAWTRAPRMESRNPLTPLQTFVIRVKHISRMEGEDGGQWDSGEASNTVGTTRYRGLKSHANKRGGALRLLLPARTRVPRMEKKEKRGSLETPPSSLDQSSTHGKEGESRDSSFRRVPDHRKNHVRGHLPAQAIMCWTK